VLVVEGAVDVAMDVEEVVELVVVVDVEEVVELVVAVDVEEEVLDDVSPVEVEIELVDVVGGFGAGRLRANHIPSIPCPLTSPGLRSSEKK